LAAGVALWAQQKAQPGGALANQSIGRVYFLADGSVELYGYFTHVEGVGVPLFDGAVSAQTARYTFRTSPSGLDYVQNLPIMQLFARPQAGAATNMKVYYDATPDQDMEEPETFSDGQLVATYQVSGTRATILPASVWNATALLRLLPDGEVIVEGQRIQPPAVLSIQVNGASLGSFDEFLTRRGAGGLTIPFGGTAYAGANQ
jgi:hypothetical protein